MLAIERRNQILTRLAVSGKVIVSELSEEFDVTEETIRRDLEKLDAEGLARKTYGGAVSVKRDLLDLPFNVRKGVFVEEKQQIALLCPSQVKDGDVVMLDSSYTAIFVAKRLKEKKKLTVITNSVEILLEFSDMSGWNVVSTGGTLKEGGLSLVGSAAIKTILNYHADLAICSVKGIDTEFGISESNEADAEIKKAMLESSDKSIIIADGSKFGKKSFVHVDDLKNIDVIITDRKPDNTWLKALDEKRIEVIFKQ